MKCLNNFIGNSAFGGGSSNSLSLDPFTELIDAADQKIYIRRDPVIALWQLKIQLLYTIGLKMLTNEFLFYNVFKSISRNSFNFKILVYINVLITSYINIIYFKKMVKIRKLFGKKWFLIKLNDSWILILLI